MKTKVIYNKSTPSGFNLGDSAMLEEEEAAKVVEAGDADYEVAPAPPPPTPSKPEVTEEEQDDDDE